MKRINITVFGASQALGLGDSQLGGWVNRLRLHLENNSQNDITVYNNSVRAATTNHIIERFETECNGRVRSQDGFESFIIFAFGGNDSSVNNETGQSLTSLKQFAENIETLARKAQELAKNVVFVSSTLADERKTVPLSFNNKVSFYNDKTVQYDNIIERIAKARNCQYVSLHSLITANDLAEDGLHQNSAGHEKIFRCILPFILEKGKLTMLQKSLRPMQQTSIDTTSNRHNLLP
jgi:lysophospholipase L1-like esterase